MKLKLFCITLAALLLISAFPPQELKINDTMTYRVEDQVYLLRYYAFGGSCSVAVYWWDRGWQYNTSITIPEDSAYEETTWIPRMACVKNYRVVQVSSQTNKVLTWNPGHPATFTNLLLKFGVPVP